MQEAYDEYLDFLFGELIKKNSPYHSNVVCWYNDNNDVLIEYTEKTGDLWITPWLWADFELFFDLNNKHQDVTAIMSSWAIKRFNLGPVNRVDSLPF